MTHREKLAHFESLLEERGFWKSNASPPIFRLLWALGLEVPPPYFLSFPRAAISAGLPFGVLFAPAVGGLLWFVFEPPPVIVWGVAVFAAVSAGASFGAMMAVWWGRQRDELDLPSWEEYPHREEGAAAGSE